LRCFAPRLVMNLRPVLSRAFGGQPRALVWPPLNLGHRGAAGEAPENTLPAFELALEQGAEGVEFDVRLSADSVPVVIHDARLDRTTSGSGWVRQHRSGALRRLDAGSWFNRRFPLRARPPYAGVKIPLLSEALAWVRARECLALVEIKDRIPGAEAAVLNEIEGAGAAGLVTVISFDLRTLRRLRRLDPRVSIGIDVSRRLLAIRRAKSLRAVALLPHWSIATPRFIQRAHQESIRVFAWTLDRPLWMRRRLLEGVDGIITNYPARLAEVRARLDRC
jgi:glycerophosphoryl diester phosphodiesterase